LPPRKPRREPPKPKLTQAALEGKVPLRTFSELSALFAAKKDKDAPPPAPPQASPAPAAQPPSPPPAPEASAPPPPTTDVEPVAPPQPEPVPSTVTEGQ